MTEVLARKDRALSPEETESLLRDRLGEQIVGSTTEFGTFTVHVDPEGWHDAVQLCRDEEMLAYDMFDNLLGIDARDEGFDVVTVLYSTTTGNRICLRARCSGGRANPELATITDIYRGADWMERETWDMFGIEFTGHPGLEPRLLTAENFEGWPLRKDFKLASRVAKPWPGVKEPAELDEDGNVIERVPGVGDAPGPYDLDKAMAEQARAANAVEGEQDDTQSEESASSGTGDVKQDQEASDAEAEPELDQETFDQLIAEGKSERIARSKAKAAFIKKQRAAAASGDQNAPAADDSAANDAGSEDGGSQDGGSDDTSAAQKAEARRQEQVEARRRKAEERAQQDKGQADEPESESDPQASDAASSDEQSTSADDEEDDA